MTLKISPVGFASLISKVTAIHGEQLYQTAITDLHDLVIDSIIEPPAQQPNTVTYAQMNELLRAISNGEKIPAIKAYRAMTGNNDLKTAKEAIEFYFPALTSTFSAM